MRNNAEFRLFKNSVLVNTLKFNYIFDDFYSKRYYRLSYVMLLHFLISHIGAYDNIDTIGTVGVQGITHPEKNVLSRYTAFIGYSNSRCQNVVYYHNYILKGYVIRNQRQVSILMPDGLRKTILCIKYSSRRIKCAVVKQRRVERYTNSAEDWREERQLICLR